MCGVGVWKGCAPRDRGVRRARPGTGGAFGAVRTWHGKRLSGVARPRQEVINGATLVNALTARNRHYGMLVLSSPHGHVVLGLREPACG